MVTTVTEYSEAPVQTETVTAHADLAPSNSSGAADPVVNLHVSGEPVRVALVPDTAFNPIELETANEYRAALKVLSEATQLTQRLADRLMDPLDGRTTEGVRTLLAHREDAPPQFMSSIEGYLYGVLTSGGTLDPTTGAVIIPPTPRETFTIAIEQIAAFQQVGFDTATWINHLYDPRPQVGQGYYVFRSPTDQNRFHELVVERVPEIAGALEGMQRIFTEATERGARDPAQHGEYVRLSRAVLAAQSRVLNDILDNVPGAFDPCSRVYLELRPGLAPEITVVPYSSEFKPELTRLSGNLLTAANLLPVEAQEIRDLITSQERWCLTSSSSPDWGSPSTRWIDAPSTDGGIDVQFHCAETVSLVGEKRNFQLVVTQHLSARERTALDIEPPTVSFAPGFGAPAVDTPYVRLLESGGAARYAATSREETIEPVHSVEGDSLTPESSVEIQKQPILVNVVPLGVTHDTASLRELDPRLVDELARASIIADGLKSANRIDSATQFILGVPGELTAHGYALAGAVANATRHNPESIQAVLNVLVGYDALVCLRSGLSGTLERATLGVIKELERHGAITLDVSSGGLRISHIDPIKLREIAKKIQHDLQLWQLGLPREAQEKLRATNDSSPDQSLAPAGFAFARQLDQITRRRLRDQARAEVEETFSEGALAPLVDKLTPLLETIPPERLVAALPTDPDIKALFPSGTSPAARHE